MCGFCIIHPLSATWVAIDRIVLNEHSQAIMNERLLCSKCHNVLWKSISCHLCGTVFCERCRPQQGLFKKLSLFLKGQSTQHEKNNCLDFREALTPHDITTDLRKLQVRCVYASNGCQAILSYNDLEEHARQCEYEMVPCEACQLPLSKRPPAVEHTLRVCFEEVIRKNPAPMQQQFMRVVNATEKAEAENRLL